MNSFQIMNNYPVIAILLSPHILGPRFWTSLLPSGHRWSCPPSSSYTVGSEKEAFTEALPHLILDIPGRFLPDSPNTHIWPGWFLHVLDLAHTWSLLGFSPYHRTVLCPGCCSSGPHSPLWRAALSSCVIHRFRLSVLGEQRSGPSPLFSATLCGPLVRLLTVSIHPRPPCLCGTVQVSALPWNLIKLLKSQWFCSSC